MTEWINRRLDRLPRLRIGPLPAFQACGIAGFIGTVLLSFAIVERLQLESWLMAAIIAAAVVELFALVLSCKVLTGAESLTYYHHHVAVSVIGVLTPLAFGRPVLPYLDVTMLGLGVFLACGRIGCLLVGCCHGQRHPWGICYPPGHVEEGFPQSFVGMRLLPVQLIEAAFVFLIVAAGTAMAIGGAPPGTAFAWYVSAYSVGRFCLEFVRGDPVRKYFAGFSEPQWTSLLLSVLIAVLAACRIVRVPWGELPALAIAAIMAVQWIAARRRNLAEIVDAADRASREPELRVASTSFGVRVSAGEVRGVRHYTLSGGRAEALDRWARLLVRTRHPRRRWRRLAGAQPGTLHVLLEE